MLATIMSARRNRQAREAMAARLRTDSEFEQFLLDHFDEEVRRAVPSNGADRLARENALLQKVGAEAVLLALGGPRYYLRWLALGGAAVGLVGIGALVQARLVPSAPSTTPGSAAPIGTNHAAPSSPVPAPPVSTPTAPAPSNTPAPPPLPPGPQPGSQAKPAERPPPGIASATLTKPPAPSPQDSAQGSKSACPDGLTLTLEPDGQHLRSRPLPSAHGFTRGGKVRLVAVSGPQRGRTLQLATITEAEPAGLLVFADSRTPSLPALTCAIPVREEIHAGRELGKILDDNRLNIGAGDGVKVGDLYEVLGPAIIDETAPGRTLGRPAIGTLRITKTDAAFSEFTRQDGQAEEGHFVRPKRPN